MICAFSHVPASSCCLQDAMRSLGVDMDDDAIQEMMNEAIFGMGLRGSMDGFCRVCMVSC